MVQNKRTPRKASSSKKQARAASVSRGRGGAPARARDLAEMELDDDLLPSGGGGRFGRCGGREITNRVEQLCCTLLQSAGIAHTHAPRFFEVRLDEKTVGAYAPEVVLRGRGREGKAVIIESAVGVKDEGVNKVAAFRKQFGLDYYVIMVAKEEVLDAIPIEAYDESCTLPDLPTLIGRLSE